MNSAIVMSGADYDKIIQQTRADALREAAGMAAKHGLLDNPTVSEIYREIIAILDQPQENVCCEWEFIGEGWHQAGCIPGGVEDWSYNEDWKFCPYCGKPIKVKE